MKIADLNNVMVDRVGEVLNHTYSIIIEGDSSSFLIHPVVDFNGHSLTVSDETGYRRTFPGELNIEVGGSSVLIFSRDKSLRIELYGMEVLSKKNKVDFHRYFSKIKFKQEVDGLHVGRVNPLVEDILYEIIDFLDSMDGSSPYNRIKLKDDTDLLLTIQNKDDRNHYELTDEGSGMDIKATDLQELLDLTGEFLSNSYESPEMGYVTLA